MTSRGQHKTYVSKHHAWLAMLVITLLGMALRSFHLGFHRLWYDEAFTAWTVAQTLRDVVWISLQDVVHPPLYYVLLMGWTRLAGNSEFALRTLSAGVSLLGVPLLYQLGLRGWNRRVGLTAAFLWACVPYAIWYAQEARMYALLTVVGLAATKVPLPGVRTTSPSRTRDSSVLRTVERLMSSAWQSCFSVGIWSPACQAPLTIWEIMAVRSWYHSWTGHVLSTVRLLCFAMSPHSGL